MAKRSDISDAHVCAAYLARAGGDSRWPHQILAEDLGVPPKVAYAACIRALHRDLIDYGVSLRGGFLTPAGRALAARVSGR